MSFASFIQPAAFRRGCLLLLLGFLCLPPVFGQSGGVVHVATYGAIPDDSLDDAHAIQQALNFAKSSKAGKVVFGAGRYVLKAVGNTALNTHVGLSNTSGLHVEGAVTAEGKPATLLVKHNPEQNHSMLPAHMRFDNCANLKISNLIFDNYPQYATAAEVVEKGQNYVLVKVLQGLPAKDGMGAYCANIWDLKTKNLKKVPSLTFIDDVAQENLFWEEVGQVGERKLLRMPSSRFAQRLNVGDGVSWHYGAETMFQLALNTCHNLTLENLLTVNIAGWGIHTYACKGITAKNINFKAEGNQLAVGPRDAWKINQCNGVVVVDSMRVEGVRWDGQNVHGIFFKALEKVADNKVKVTKRFASVAAFVNDSIGFWDTDHQVKFLATNWELLSRDSESVTGIITIQGTVPDFVQDQTLISIDAWDLDAYHLRNSFFKNIAGCGSVIKNEKAYLFNVNYDYIMYPAILFGAEINVHSEGTFPQDILVEQCRFSNSGWVNRIGKRGLVGIGNDGNANMTMGAIEFRGCHFADADVGLDISGIRLVKVNNSTFSNVGLTHAVNQANTGSVVFNGSTIQHTVKPFTPGSLVVTRVGDGASLLSGATVPVFLDEYSRTGKLLQRVPLPTAVSGPNKRLTLTGNTVTEGYASLSPDGKSLALIGYDSAPGSTTAKTSASTAVNRTVGVVSPDASVNTTTALTDAFSAVEVRSALASGNQIWVAGGNIGIRYTTLGATTSTAITNITGRSLGIFKGQLYGTSTGGTSPNVVRLGKVGTGTPATAGQAFSNLPGLQNLNNPVQFFFADLSDQVPGVDVVYVTELVGQKVSKYSLVQNAWVPNGAVSATSGRGLTGEVSNGVVTLFAVRGLTAGGELIKVTDASGYNADCSASPITSLGTAPGNTAFRGVSFSPGDSPLTGLNLVLDHSSIAENSAAGTSVGTFSAGADEPGTRYLLVSGTGGADNLLFSLENKQLKADVVFDYEARSSYSIRVRAENEAGLEQEQVFTIAVNNVNEAPTALNLSNTNLDENKGAGALVGTLSATDPDTGTAHTYSLVSGEGSQDNALFLVEGNELKAVSGFDYEAGSSYSVRIQAADAGGLHISKAFHLTVTDLNEAPDSLALTLKDFGPRVAAGTILGDLATADQDQNDAHTYALVAGEGDADNAGFALLGQELHAAAPLNFAAKPAYAIRVRTTDRSGLVLETPLLVQALPLLAGHPQEERLLLLYPNPTGRFLKVFPISWGGNKVQVFDMHGNEKLTGLASEQGLDVSALPPGPYILRIGEGPKQIRKPFFKR